MRLLIAMLFLFLATPTQAHDFLGGGFGGGFLGGALGGFLGSQFNRPPPPVYYPPPGYPPEYGTYGPERAVRYCMSRFRSYDPRTGVYIGYDGVPRRCP